MEEAKPNTALYKKILEELDCSSENIIIIDDKEHNLAVASTLGMQTHLFENVDKLKAFLDVTLI